MINPTGDLTCIAPRRQPSDILMRFETQHGVSLLTSSAYFGIIILLNQVWRHSKTMIRRRGDPARYGELTPRPSRVYTGRYSCDLAAFVRIFNALITSMLALLAATVGLSQSPALRFRSTREFGSLCWSVEYTHSQHPQVWCWRIE